MPDLIEKKRRARHKSRKTPYDFMKYTTGNIDLNVNHFNKRMGTFGLGVDMGETPDTIGDFGNSAESAGGALCEAKRYVRRYYIRPQNIFCSNKAEILKALIELENANCSVYTLNNLGDEKDVSKLMNSDIIYYYDDGILYDKNRVKVMDYDLSIKKEENRKHFANVEKTSEKEFKNEYKDRMTDATELEEAVQENMLPFSFEEFQKALAEATSQDSVIDLGNSNPMNEDACSYDWEVYTQDNQIVVTGWGYNAYTEEDGIEDSEYFDSTEEAYEYIKGIAHKDPYAKLSLQIRIDEAFNLEYDDYNVYGEKLTEAKDEELCCICKEKINGYGNNPEPYMSAKKGRCCDACNMKFVVPSRLFDWEEE